VVEVDDICQCEVSRKAWEILFPEEACEVAGLRRAMRLHLQLWGLSELADRAELCVTELVSNVITHVGHGTPVTLTVSMKSTHLRIEVRDPDARALPTLVSARADEESGRGMALIDALTDRWGVVLSGSSEITWCEFATTLTGTHGHAGGSRVTQAEAFVMLYWASHHPKCADVGTASVAVAEEAAIDLMADVLHWLRAHGCDPDEALDRAQMHFDAELEGSA
jgi:anti-sigma regulatory factor (Ser/Thr protein kinase)